jgi:hypothetical protein
VYQQPVQRSQQQVQLYLPFVQHLYHVKISFMSKNYFLPRADADKAIWLQNYSSKLPKYAGAYGISDAEVSDMLNASTDFNYWLNYQTQNDSFQQKLTQYKNDLRDGVANGAQAVPPSPPNIAGAPTVVQPGIFKRAAAIAALIKSRSNYNEADGKDLGIIGSEAAHTDVAAAKPVITLRLTSGGHPEIVWKKGDMDGIDIYVDRGSGQWQFLATDTYPNYTDTAPLPAAGQTALWKYKTIYRYNDEQAGQWSDVASITVSGG